MKRLLPASLVLIALHLVGCLTFHAGPLPGEPPSASYAQLGNTRVRYAVQGTGERTVVMIHGFASSLGVWAAVAPELAKTHRVVTLDLRGFGWTDRPAADYSPASQAKLVLRLMDQIGVDQAAVVAHSWGASVALEMALQAPKRVERLALYDAWVYEEQIPTTFKWARTPALGEVIWAMFYKERPDEKMELAFYDSERWVTESFVEEVERNLDRPGTTAAALAAVRGQRYREVQSRYPSITQPTLLLWGAQDRVTTLDVGHRLERDLPNAEMAVFEQCGHFPMIEAYEASTRRVAQFIEAPN